MFFIGAVVTSFTGACVLKVLGIDPGLTRCGIAVVSGAPGRSMTLHGVGVARTRTDDELAQRLLSLEAEISDWVEHHTPDAVAVERVFSQHNLHTVMGTAKASGVAMLAAARHGLRVVEHTPSEVKAAVTGSGGADKEQVAHMVTRLLRLEHKPKPADASDALALAICHIWRGAGQDRLAAAVAAHNTKASL